MIPPLLFDLDLLSFPSRPGPGWPEAIPTSTPSHPLLGNLNVLSVVLISHVSRRVFIGFVSLALAFMFVRAAVNISAGLGLTRSAHLTILPW